MTWFGWAFIVIYVLAMLVEMAKDISNSDGAGFVIDLLMFGFILIGVLYVGTGTGVLDA